MPTANLQAVVDKIAPAIAKVKGNPQTQEFLRKAEEANVLQCAVDLLANSPIVLREPAANNIEIIKGVQSDDGAGEAAGGTMASCARGCIPTLPPSSLASRW
jgi:hypothetical protein